MKPLIVIVGPTSSGKTSLAINLCEKTKGQIISADSRQVIKHMDIGTGKLPLSSQNSTSKVETKQTKKFWIINNTKIWGYDLVTPEENFTAYDYAFWAKNKINEFQTKNIQAFLVGGTGFYIDTVTERVILEQNDPNYSLREELESKSLGELQTQYNTISGDLKDENINESDFQNKRRLVRRIERIIFEKKDTQAKNNDVNISEDIRNKNQLQKNKPNAKILPKLKTTKIYYIGLTAPREILYQRSDNWLDSIWENGLLKETSLLLQKYPTSEKLTGLIYKSAVSFLQNEANENEAKQRAKFDIHAYIRRQQTWFKRNKDIKWFDISNSNYKNEVMEYVLTLLSQ